jgi:hypothetical protein
MKVAMKWTYCLDVGNENCFHGLEYQENDIKAEKRYVGGKQD